MALVDTGASITAIDVPILSQLGVNPVGKASVGTADGPALQSTFPARIAFPGTGFPGFEIPAALGCNLQGQIVAMNQKPIIALIGRDILSRFVFIYNGSAGMFTLSC